MGDYERLCAIEPNLRLESYPPKVGLDSGTIRLVGQR